MSFWLTCIPTVCSPARLDKHERTNQSVASFVRRIHRELTETSYTGPAMPKHLIKHQRSTSNAKNINQTNNKVPHDWSFVRESVSEQWIHGTHDQQYKKHKSCNSMIITQVLVRITHKTAGQSTVGMQAFYTINIRNSFHYIYMY